MKKFKIVLSLVLIFAAITAADVYKSTACKLAVYAVDITTGLRDANDPNITIRISKDGGALTTLTSPTVTEVKVAGIHSGVYTFNLTAAETDANLIVIEANSTTANIGIDPLIIITSTKTNYTLLAASISAGTFDGITAKASTNDPNVVEIQSGLAKISQVTEINNIIMAKANTLSTPADVNKYSQYALGVFGAAKESTVNETNEIIITAINTRSSPNDVNVILSAATANIVAIKNKQITNDANLSAVAVKVAAIQIKLGTEDANLSAVAVKVAAIQTKLGTEDANLSAASAKITAIYNKLPTGKISDFNNASEDVNVSDKTGFKLASDGLNTIATTEPSGVASNFREMLVQTWRRFFKKCTQDTTTIKTYKDNGILNTTQIITTVGGVTTVGDANGS